MYFFSRTLSFGTTYKYGFNVVHVWFLLPVDTNRKHTYYITIWSGTVVQGLIFISFHCRHCYYYYCFCFFFDRHPERRHPVFCKEIWRRNYIVLSLLTTITRLLFLYFTASVNAHCCSHFARNSFRIACSCIYFPVFFFFLFYIMSAKMKEDRKLVVKRNIIQTAFCLPFSYTERLPRFVLFFLFLKIAKIATIANYFWFSAALNVL